MIVGFMLAGIIAGFFAGIFSLFAGVGFLGALGVYALTGFVVMTGGVVFTYAWPQTLQGPLVQGA